MSVLTSPPVCTNYFGILPSPTDFPIFSALTAASTSSRITGRYSLSGTCGQSSTVGSPSV